MAESRRKFDAEFREGAVRMAAATRGGSVDGVIFHSDRGSEYCSTTYSDLCDRLGVVQSMGRVGSCFDNAAAESFNSTIKVEYIHRQRFATRSEARIKIATWIADFYNTRRRHSAADGLPPAEFERVINETRNKHDQEHLAA